jgi:hypothetical protein
VDSRRGTGCEKEQRICHARKIVTVEDVSGYCLATAKKIASEMQ